MAAAPRYGSARRVTTLCSSSGVATTNRDAIKALKGLEVLRATDGKPVEVLSLWGPEERAVVVFGRSFG